MAERVEDLNLPNSVVGRIIKDSLPEGVNVSKETRTAVGRAASVFVLYLTSAANTVAVQENRKTITAKDVFRALEDTNFDAFIPQLEETLKAFRKSQENKPPRVSKKKDQLENPDKENGETENGDKSDDVGEAQEEEEDEEADAPE